MKPSICFVSVTELHKLRNKSSFTPTNVSGLSDVLSDLEIPMKMVAIISSKPEQNAPPQTPCLPSYEDKENVSPTLSPASSTSSLDDDTDQSGKPLPMQKLADLSVVTNKIPLDHHFDQMQCSVRKIYSLGIRNRLDEIKARHFLSSILAELRRMSLPSWMSDGLALIVPFADQSALSGLAHCLVIGPEDSNAIKCIDVKCVKENISINHLPNLKDLKQHMARIANSKEEPRTQFEAVYSLGAVNNEDGGCHVTVRYSAKWEHCVESSSSILNIPNTEGSSQLLIRPIFGHPKSQLRFIFESIQRLKVLSDAISTQANEWESDVDPVTFSKNLLPNFRRLSVLTDAVDKKEFYDETGPGIEADGSTPTDAADSASRWRNVVSRRKRDVTEVLWMVLQDVNSFKNLRQHMQSLLRYIAKERLSFSVTRSNDTGLALVFRRLNAHGVPDFSNGLEMLVEVGFFALHRDLATLLTAVLAAEKDLQLDLPPLLSFFAEEGILTREERLRRLARLHRACEFAVLLGLHSKQTGLDVRHVFNVFKKDSVDELVFHYNKCFHLDNEVPTFWGITQEYSNGVILKQLFKRPVHEVISTHDQSFVKFTNLKIITKTV